MERQAVRSRDIAIVGYDSKRALLEIAFRSGNVYHYENVPSGVHAAFLEAPSHGMYFRDHIRDQFSASKVA